MTLSVMRCSTALTAMRTAVARPRSETAGRPRGRGGGPLLAVVLAAQFMALLDVFIVNVAAPTIRGELAASGAGLQLVIAGYTIAYAVLLITGARLGDLIGHRRAYLAGLGVFTAASLACGLAAGTGQLIAFRLVQGAGAAVMIPQVLSLIQRNFTGEGRARALSAYSAVLATGAAAGQVLGGLVVSADLFGTSWRPVFLVNVPIGLALFALGRRVLPADRDERAEHARPLDLMGLALLAAAVSLLTVPLVLGQEQGWPLWTRLSLGGAAVVFTAFCLAESALARRGGAPLIAPHVLRIPGMGRSVLWIGGGMAVNAGFLFTLTLHLQGGLGQSALRAGLTFAPMAVVFGVVGLTWRRLPVAAHRFLVPGGFTLAGVSVLALGLLLRDGGDGGPLLYGAFGAFGAGVAAAFGPALTGTLATVRSQDAADTSGLLATVTQLGQLLGIAVFGTLFLGRLEGAGASGSGGALWACALALFAVCVLGSLTGLVRKRR
ncbi:MFS transporter [Streptomyces zhihengii]